MKVLVFIGNNVDLNKYNFNDYYVIGVDSGAFTLISNNIKCDEAIGDFDSCNISSLNISNITKLNPIKDDTDTFIAIKRAYELSSNVTILGGIQGSRIEHFIANISLFKKYPNLKIIDDNSIIYSITNNDYIYKDEYKYISLFALKDSNITLKGFKYNLNNFNLLVFDPLCISNEIIDKGEILINQGQILVIKSKNDNKIE